MLDYLRDAAEIYRRSFAVIRAEADLARFPADVARVVVRLIHTCGQVDVAEHVAYTDDVVARAGAALAAGAPVLCDSSMVAAGITTSRLPADNQIVSLVADPRATELAARRQTTRSAAGVELCAERLPGAVLAIGNAPTALFRLLELVDEGAPPPAAVLGGPVGFVGSAQAKEELIERPRGMSYLVVRCRRQCDSQRPRMSARGTLWGVGLGPGDPELVTVKAARVIGEADVVAYHSAPHGHSIARGIAEPYLRPGQLEEHLVYPVTTEATNHPGGYAGALEDFYADATERIATHLDAGRNVALLAEGDPLFYSSYMHLHTRLTRRFNAVIVPGVTSVSAASAAVATPLVAGDQVLSVLPGTLPVGELTRRLADADAAVVVKLGRSYHNVREALSASGLLGDAFYVERASTAGQRVLPAADVDETSVPYFSLAMLPGGRRRALLTGTVAVVGLGPGDSDWMTPQSRRELAAATDLIGYRGYLDRVEVRDGQRRHPSDNTDEPARARLACSLADQGRAVAVVSSGDPGVFAMATAVLEEAEQWPGVRVRVIPAMTAAQAVASRVGAPLGHDYAVISLSDRLKPWDVIAARLTAAAAADLVLAIYNPASVTRTWQVGAMRELLLAHRDPGIPVVIGRNVSGPVSGPNEDVRVVKLADLNPAEIDMRCLLIVGSSQTRWYSVDSQDRVFTPRRYPEAGRATATKSSRHSD